MTSTKAKHFRSRKLPLLMLVGTLAIGLQGCATMREDSTPLAGIDAQQIRLAEDIEQQPSPGGWPQAQWWHRYDDNQLDALIQQALKDAPTMAVAKARVEAGRTQAALTDANRGLLVDLTGSLNRQSVSENGFLGPFALNVPAEGMTGPWYTEGTLGLAMAYSFDPWGKDRARVDATLGAYHARRAEEAQAELLLSARVAQTYFDIQALYATVGLLEQARDIENEMVAAHSARAGRGLEAQTQTEMARSHKFELDQQISAANSMVHALRETLRALVGAGPDRLAAIAVLPLPSCAGRPPASLGYELLARRPDLQAMRWYIQASLSRVDAAKAAFYPSFDIKAFFGFDALHLEDLLRLSSRQVNLAPGLTLPVFDSGRLNAMLAGARAESNVVIAQYNQSVLDAVRDVAQTGIELEGLDRQARIQDAKLKAVAFSLDSAEAHYRRGLADVVTAREAKLPVLFEQAKDIELRKRQIDTEIALTMALGGGYRNETSGAGQ